MENIGYQTIALVLESWDGVRRAYKGKHYEKEFGKVLIDKFIELQPRSKSFYKGEEMMNKHADGIVHLLDSILQMLGPDVEFIQEILSQVGKRHAKMGVKAAFFPFLGQSLVWALKETVGDSLTDEHKEAWNEVYDSISSEIVKEILNAWNRMYGINDTFVYYVNIRNESLSNLVWCI